MAWQAVVTDAACGQELGVTVVVGHVAGEASLSTLGVVLE